LLVTLVFPFAWHFALAAVGPHLLRQFGVILAGKILTGAAFVPLAVLVHFGLRRLANLGMSRWWLVAAFAPILNLWVGYRCFACPPGYASHKRIDGGGIALAIPYWLIVLSGMLVLSAAAAPFFGVVVNPELQEHVRAAIRSANTLVSRLH
jgi:hypothetical protein